MTNQVAEVDKVTNSPSKLIELAISTNADIEKLEKLMALQERWEAKEAKKAFYQALSNFQRECPVIKKNRTVDFTSKDGRGRTNYNYANLASIEEQIKEPMAKYGLSKTFKQDHSKSIEVTCCISHVDGHSECVSMHSNSDTTGNKNSIQAIGSAVTYLQRYTLLSALGITTADEDKDGAAPKPKPAKVTPEAMTENQIRAAIKNWVKLNKINEPWDMCRAKQEAGELTHKFLLETYKSCLDGDFS